MAPQAPNPNELLKQLLTAAFPASRPPRSGAYIDGTRAAMELLLLELPLRCDYAGGSASFDAFQAGAVEGREIWARHMEAQLLTRRAQPANAADLLAAELLHAEKIILEMLPMLSGVQKDMLGSALEAQGVIDNGDAGLTRYHERRAALTDAGFALPPASIATRQRAQAAG